MASQERRKIESGRGGAGTLTSSRLPPRPDDYEARRLRINEYNRRRYADDPEVRRKSKENAAKWRRIAKERTDAWIRERKAAGCLICGEKEAICLDFHHTDPASKEVLISRLRTTMASVKRLRSEMDKCVVLCGNCHRKLHAGLLELP